jgi:hypothetical protein
MIFDTALDAAGIGDAMNGNVSPPGPAGLVGDYNNNGHVDAADYVLWRDGGPLQNDPTPGVEPADYSFWRAHFGNSAASTSLAATSVPEPATLVLLLLAGAVLLMREVKSRR